MSLILAIEPDRRQSLTLTSLSRARLNVELVLGETVNRALDKLGSRRPDLVLTSPALSQKDEATLASRLRALESGSTPVPRMVIPVFGPPPPEKKTGTLGRLKPPHGSKQPAHCDPLAFSEQIADCLELAAAERAALAAAQAEFEAAWAADVSPRQRWAATTVPHPPAIAPVAAAVAPHPELPLLRIESPVLDETPATSMFEPVDEGAPTDAGGEWEELSLEAAPTADATTVDAPVTDEPTFLHIDLETLAADLEAPTDAPDAPPEMEPSTPVAADGMSPEPIAAAAPEANAIAEDGTGAAVDTVAADAAVDAVAQDAAVDAVVEDAAEDAAVDGAAAVTTAADDTPSQAAHQLALAAPIGDRPADQSIQPTPASAEPDNMTPVVEVAGGDEHDEPGGGTEPEHAVAIAGAGLALVDFEFPPSADTPRPDHRRLGEGNTSSIGPTAGWQDVLSAIRRDIQQLRGDEPAGRPRPAPARVDDKTAPQTASPQVPVPSPQVVDPPASPTPIVQPIVASAQGSERGAHADHRSDADGPETGLGPDSVDPMPWRPRLSRPIGRVVPVQDEWGFFDPQQCGFEALRAKLLEMIEANRADKPRPA